VLCASEALSHVFFLSFCFPFFQTIFLTAFFAGNNYKKPTPAFLAFSFSHKSALRN
jgi:hypothetical protein